MTRASLIVLVALGGVAALRAEVAGIASQGITVSLQGVLGIIGTTIVVLTALGGALGLFVRMLVKQELGLFLVTLNGTYVRTQLYEVARSESDRRISVLEAAAIGARSTAR